MQPEIYYDMTIEEIQKTTEFQVFDRKSAQIEAKALAVLLIAFANADGGTAAIGVENDGRITGVDGMQEHINELLRAGFDFCVPSILTTHEYRDVTDFKGQKNHIILMRVAPSMKVHANQADEVFYRVGDKSKKLTFAQRTQLMYAKGERFFENAPVHDARMEDLDMALVEDYVKRLDYSKSVDAFIRENGFITKVEDFRGEQKEYLTSAAVLLFGKNPQRFFERARVRVIRYDGTEAKVGTEMNVVKDETFTGPVLKMTDDVLTFVKTQVKEHTYLGPDGRFRTDDQYPEFCWTELCVNSICHRDYSILGTDIQVKIFDDHITVESPGIFPGLVRPANIRHTHFSRNPKIAAYMHEYKLVKEYGEGVDRMYREMEEAGNPAPEFKQQDFMVLATIRERKGAIEQDSISNSTSKSTSSTSNSISEKILRLVSAVRGEMSIRDMMEVMGMKSRPMFLNNYLTPALKAELLERTQPDSPNSPTQKYRLTEEGRKMLEGAK